jgi:xylose isomerase
METCSLSHDEGGMALLDLRPQAARRTPEQLLHHLKHFDLDLRFSAGIWCHEPKSPALSIEQRLEIAGRLKESGLCGLEIRYPGEINYENLELWKTFTRDTGLRLITIIPLLSGDRKFTWGSLSSPLPEVRREAIERTKEALALNRQLDTDFAVVWTGIGGHVHPFGIDFPALHGQFADALAEAMDGVPGVRVAFQPGPCVSRSHMPSDTTAEGLILGSKVENLLRAHENHHILSEGHALCCLAPEIGRASEDFPAAYAWPLSEGRLAHVHVNVGLLAAEQLEALFYLLKMRNYQGYVGIDAGSGQLPAEITMQISMDAVRAANDRINQLDHESILYAVHHPDRAHGWLEAYLVRMHSPQPERLRKLPPLR